MVKHSCNQQATKKSTVQCSTGPVKFFEWLFWLTETLSSLQLCMKGINIATIKTASTNIHHTSRKLASQRCSKTSIFSFRLIRNSINQPDSLILIWGHTDTIWPSKAADRKQNNIKWWRFIKNRRTVIRWHHITQSIVWKMGIIKWNKEFQGEQTFLEPELSKYEIEKSWQVIYGLLKKLLNCSFKQTRFCKEIHLIKSSVNLPHGLCRRAR